MVMAGYVLCGGRSTRMGQDKALLKVEGVPLAVRAARTLGLAGCQPVALVGRQPGLSELDYPVLCDDLIDFHHPLLGVATALRNAVTARIMVAPCDLIDLDVAHIEALMAPGSPCVASIDGRVHPLLCVLSREMSAQALASARASVSAREFVAGLPVVALPPPLITDANSLPDLAR